MPFKKGHKTNVGRKQSKEHIEKCRKAKIGKKRPEHSEYMKKNSKLIGRKVTKEERKKISERMKKTIKENGHPRGFLGGKHSKESRKKMSIASKKNWSDPYNYVNSDEYRQILSDRASKLQQKGIFKNRYSNSKKGTYNINGKKIFFRSLWEANYALYLDFLIKQGQILKWEFEPDTFWFEKIRRGVRSYKPDFKILNNDNTEEYHEVKGWMDSKSKTKLNRMRIYYPEVKILLIDKDIYNDLKIKLGSMLKFY